MGYRVQFAAAEDFVSGGLISNEDVEFRDCRWEYYDYEGKGNTTLAFRAALHIIRPDGSVDEQMAGDRYQYWSAGDPNKFIPVEDGRYLEAEDEHAKLSASSNFAFFRAQHEAQGFKLPDSDAYLYNGLRAHVVRVPSPERGNMNVQIGDDGKPRVKEVLVISKIIAKPGTAKSPAKTAKPPIRGTAGTVKPAATSSSSSTVPTNEEAENPEQIAEAVLATIVGDDPSSFSSTRSDFNKKALQLMMPNGIHKVGAASLRNKVLGILKDDEKLNEMLGGYGLAADAENIGSPE